MADELLAAASAGDVEGLRRLLAERDAHGLNEADLAAALRAAAFSGQAESVSALLQAGADPDVRDPSDDSPFSGASPLHLQAIFDRPAVARLLLEAGADVNAATDAGATALHLAAQNGSESVAAVLLEHGAEVNASDNEGQTPLMMAAFGGHSAVVKALLDGGAAVDPWDRLGRTAAHWAAQAQPVDLRIDVTGEIGLGDRDLGDWVQVLELLADHGADLNAKGFKGATPLALAMRAGNTRLADAIRRRGGRAGAGCGATLLAAVLTAVCGLLALQAVLALLGGS